MEVTVHEAKTHLSRLIARAEAGEEIVIKRGRKPVVRLSAIEPPAPRKLGRYDGEVEWSDAFFDPLPDEILDAMENEDPL